MITCAIPNIDPKHERMHQLLLEKVKGDRTELQRELIKHKGYPQDIVDLVEAEFGINFPSEDRIERLTDDITGNRKDKLLAQIQTLNKKQIKLIKRKVDNDKQFTKTLEALVILEKELAEYEIKHAFAAFVSTAYKQVKYSEEIIDKINKGEIPLNVHTINHLITNMNALDIVEEIRRELEDEKGFEETVKELKTIIPKISKIVSDAVELQRVAMAQELLPEYFSTVEAYWRRNAEINFNKEIAPTLNLKSSELRKRKKEYIDGIIADNQDVIQTDTHHHVKQMLRVVPKDLSWVTSSLINPRDISQPFIQHIVRVLDYADHETKMHTINARDRMKEVHDKYVEYVGRSSDGLKQYEALIDYDITENPSGKLVNPGSRGESLEKYKQIINGKYTGTPVQEYYDHLVALNTEKDKGVPKSKRIGKYGIPNMNKNFIERLYANGIMNAITAGNLDKIRLTASDEDMGELSQEEIDRLKLNKTNEEKEKALKEKFLNVFSDIAGRERKLIPIHFRARTVTKDRSFDLPTLFIVDEQNIKNFKEKIKVEGSIDAYINILEHESTKVTQRGEKNKIKRDSGKDVNQQAISSKIYKVIQEIRDHRVYGIHTKEVDPKVVKRVEALKGYSSLVNLGANYLAAGANFLHGTTMSWIEVAGSRTGLYGRKERVHGAKRYYKAMANGDLVKDIMKLVPESTVNKIVERFNPHQKFEANHFKFNENNVIKRQVKTSTSYGLFSMGEHALQTISTLAVMNKIKVLDKDGNYLTKDGITNDPSKALGLDEVYTKDSKGNLVLDERVDATDRFGKFNSKTEFYVASLIQRQLRDTYGNFSVENKSTFQRSVIGSLVSHMRGWMEPGFTKRYRNFGLIAKDRETLDIHDLQWNAEVQRFEEGMYTTTLSFLVSLGKELKAKRTLSLSENWNKLTDEEKSNVHKTVAEVSAMVLALLVFCMAKANADDDDDETSLMIAYFSRRLYSELATYWNVNEGIRTVRSPAISISLLEKGVDFTAQLFYPTEIYETGKRSGQYKIVKKGKDLIPFLRQDNRNIKDALNWLINN
jgi:hypothetical protein